MSHQLLVDVYLIEVHLNTQFGSFVVILPNVYLQRCTSYCLLSPNAYRLSLTSNSPANFNRLLIPYCCPYYQQPIRL